MINWPIAGNDYCQNANRLLDIDGKKQEFVQECYWHSRNFAHFIQTQFGQRYGLAENLFPHANSAFALHPYYRESRRLVGLTTISEQDILPLANSKTASLFPDAIAVGNYANDHHYPGVEFLLQSKSIRWGGRWTGTPFTIPYRALIPTTTDGFLVCEKNIQGVEKFLEISRSWNSQFCRVQQGLLRVQQGLLRVQQGLRVIFLAFASLLDIILKK
jgi:hypothetical protein